MRKIRKLTIIFFAVTGIALFSCNADPTSVEIPNSEILDSILDSYVKNGFYPFIYARLENKHGQVIYEHSTVNPSLLSGKEINGQSWMRIWSMSKPVTISTVLDLVEEGIISLDDPVTDYIPEFADLKVALSPDGTPLALAKSNDAACPLQLVPMESTMTVLHLINHEAGFYYQTTGISCLDSMMAAQNLPAASNSQDLIDRLVQLPIVQQPGTGYFYGSNTTVLGLVAERATGKDLRQLVEERLTGPLLIGGLRYGLPDGEELLPYFSGRDTLIREAIPGELDIFGSDLPDYDPDHRLYLGGEGMLATADSYADFLRMLLNGGELNGNRFLDKSTVAEIHAPHTQLDSPYGYNGYNLWISGDSLRVQGKGDAGLWIGGGYEGTHFWVDPKRDFVAVVMTQMFWTQPGAYGMLDQFRGAIYKQLLKDDKPEV